MSKIIKCKVCGKEKDKTQKICPHCGKKTPFYKKKSFFLIVLLSILIILSSIKDTKVNAHVTTTEGVAYYCTGYEIKEYYDEYSDNEENPYYGALVEVTDEIVEVEKRFAPYGYVFLDSGWVFLIGPGDMSVESFEKEMIVSIKGEIATQNDEKRAFSSKYTLISLEDCSIM